MRYTTVIYSYGENIGKLISEKIQEGFAVYSVWENPGQPYYSSSYNVIVTYIKPV